MINKQEFDKRLYNKWNGLITEQGFHGTHKPCTFYDKKTNHKWTVSQADYLIEKGRKYPYAKLAKKGRTLSMKSFMKRLSRINKKNNTKFKPAKGQVCKGSHKPIIMADLNNIQSNGKPYTWKTTPKKILTGYGYKRIGVNVSYTIPQLQKLVDKMYGKNIIIILSKKNKGTSVKLWAHCNRHNTTWKVRPHNLLSGHGCPLNRTSHGEAIMMKVLVKHNIHYKYSYRTKNSNKREALHLDFYLPQIKLHKNHHLYKNGLAFEIDGIQHRKPVKYFGGVKSFYAGKIHDYQKNLYCKKNNILLVRIPYYNNQRLSHFRKQCIKILKNLSLIK